MDHCNVLLGDHCKVSDFGMARIFGGDQAAARTNRVVGTNGYMSPEYAMEGRFSIKFDVYSFGILLLKILTGRKNIVYYADRPFSNLLGHVWELWKEGKDSEIIDSKLKKSCPANVFSYDFHNFSVAKRKPEEVMPCECFLI